MVEGNESRLTGESDPIHKNIGGHLLSGIVACIALLLYVMMLLLVMRYLNATLTLPGIAGIILSIGMAVDANVLIFERFKE